jgi:hypothetical protein
MTTATTGNWILTEPEWRTVLRSYQTDRAATHKPCACRRCGLQIEETDARASFCLRNEQGRSIKKGFVHKVCVKPTQLVTGIWPTPVKFEKLLAVNGTNVATKGGGCD